MAQTSQIDEDEAFELTYEDGDECPVDGCDHTLRVRDYGKPSTLGADPVGPVKEADCVVHGIVESV